MSYGSAGKDHHCPCEDPPGKGAPVLRATRVWHSASLWQNATQEPAFYSMALPLSCHKSVAFCHSSSLSRIAQSLTLPVKASPEERGGWCFDGTVSAAYTLG